MNGKDKAIWAHLQHSEQYGCAPLTGRQAMQRDWSEGASLYASGGGGKYLNQAERVRALAEMEKLPGPQALFALTLAWTGARVSEVLALTPSSFQVERIIMFVSFDGETATMAISLP
jgi:integrase